VALIEGMTLDVDLEDYYGLYRLIKMTGWSIEYISGLGYADREILIQIDEASTALSRPRSNKGKTPWQ
jgi:hypothetical protein